jgi:hypothetical protein
MRASRPVRGTLKALKSEALALIDEGEAIEILVNIITPRRIVDFQEIRELVLATQSAKTIRDVNARGRDQITQMRNHYGIVATASSLRLLLKEARAVPEGEVMWARKTHLTRLLSLYDNQAWPPHAQIMVDPHGTQPRFPDIEVRLLEATLYEDMCVLFNQAKRTAGMSKSDLKTANALCRATITSAYYFVEAYLNGLAVRHLAAKGQSIDDATRDLLTEWDSKKNRQSTLTFREKVLKYSRIASGKPHPPIQESNCPEMQILTDVAKQLRDSIVHASALPDRITHVPEKELAVFQMGILEAERVVDAAVPFVRKVEEATFGNADVLHWLEVRSPNGFFPESALS